MFARVATIMATSLPDVCVHHPTFPLHEDSPHYDVTVLLSADVKSLLSLSQEDRLGPIAHAIKAHEAIDHSITRQGSLSFSHTHAHTHTPLHTLTFFLLLPLCVLPRRQGRTAWLMRICCGHLVLATAWRS